MRRESSEVVAAAARRRLEQLARDLGRELPPIESGSPRAPGREPEPEPAVPEVGGLDAEVRPAVLRAPGRHSRSRGAGLAARVGGWVRDRVPPTELRPPHLPLLLVLCVIAVAAAAWFTLRGAPEPVPVARTSAVTTGLPVAMPSSPAATPVTTPAAPESGSATKPGAASGWVVVDVAGKVHHPGVATLPAGSRVVDAVRRAGGAQPGVDLSSINLARVLVDGEQILVGVAPVPGPAAAGATKPGAGDGPVVNLNTADLAALDSLPGVGPVTAQKILDWRTEHGTFSAVDELLEVDGIGARTLEELAPHVTL